MTYKILVITRNFPPMIGGMERLIYEATKGFHENFQVKLIGPNGCQPYLPDATQASESKPDPIYRFLVTSYFQTLRATAHWRPDLIFCGSGLTAPTGLFAARLYNARCMVYAHGLDLTVPHPLYQKLFLPAIRKADHLVVNSGYTAQLAINKQVAGEKITVISPGVTLGTPSDLLGRKFRKKYGLGHSPLLLSVGRLTPRKGLAQFISRSMPAVLSACPRSKLVVVGGQPTKALYGGSAYQAINTATSKLPADSVHLLGNISDEDLAGAYSAASAFVFPIIEMSGDVEGFGMAALEAAANRVPSIAFASGGVSDAIKNKHSGFLVEPGNYSKFSDLAIELLRGVHPRLPKLAFEHARKNSWEKFANKMNACIADQFPKIS